MKARDVIGKRIIAVEHMRWYDRQCGRWRFDVIVIRLDDGSELRPHAYETETEPTATIFYVEGEAMKKDELAEGCIYVVRHARREVRVKLKEIRVRPGWVTSAGRRHPSTTVYACLNLQTNRMIALHSALKFIRQDA